MKKQTSEQTETLTPKDVAEILGVSKQRVHQMLRSGRLKAKKLGGKYFISAKDVEPLKERKVGRPRKEEATKGKKREVWRVRIDAIVTIERKSDATDNEDE